MPTKEIIKKNQEELIGEFEGNKLLEELLETNNITPYIQPIFGITVDKKSNKPIINNIPDAYEFLARGKKPDGTKPYEPGTMFKDSSPDQLFRLTQTMITQGVEVMNLPEYKNADFTFNLTNADFMLHGKYRGGIVCFLKELKEKNKSLDPSRIHLEFIEEVDHSNPIVKNAKWELDTLGFHVSIDDFSKSNNSDTRLSQHEAIEGDELDVVDMIKISDEGGVFAEEIDELGFYIRVLAGECILVLERFTKDKIEALLEEKSIDTEEKHCEKTLKKTLTPKVIRMIAGARTDRSLPRLRAQSYEFGQPFDPLAANDETRINEKNKAA